MEVESASSSYPPSSLSKPEASSIAETQDNSTNGTTEHSSESPYRWSRKKKLFVTFLGLLLIFNAVFDSSLPGGASDELAAHFGVDDNIQLVLPISLYLVGYVLGPLLFGPLSEIHGRRPVLILTFIAFTVFTMATALAPNWTAFLIFRLICGTCASSALTVVGGMYADIYKDPKIRGRAMNLFLLTTVAGPQPAPVVSGFIAKLNWNWPYWVGFAVAGVSLMPILFLPETYAPALASKQRARRSNEPDLNHRIDHPAPAKHTASSVLTRPLKLLFLEPVCALTCLFLSYASALFFLFFEAYPIIFQGTYNLSAGIAGLAFLPIALGGLSGFLLTLIWDSLFQRAVLRSATWTKQEEYRRLPLACFGGPLYVISLLWLGWTAKPSVHPAIPMFSGVPFGAGFYLIFVALLNYLADAYTTQAASALAAASCARSIFGAVLPLAAPAMYERLDVSWASTLLAGLSLLMSAIPFAFLRWGWRLRLRGVAKKSGEKGPV